MAPTDPPDSVPAVAAFDLDGTLTEGGSVVRWLVTVAGATATRRAILANAGGLVGGAVRSGAAADEAKEALFRRVLGGRDLAEVAAVSSAFADAHLRAQVRPEVAARLGAHLDLGHTVIVVSASPALYVGTIAASLGAHGYAATDLAVCDGRLTGGYQGANCRGQEKLRKAREVLQGLGITATGPECPLYAYGNSRGDLRLLHAADRPVDVSKLGKLGRLGRFPRMDAVPVA
jgi:phosphatidylglycerophosphatase C